MNCDMHLTDKLAVYKREVNKLGIKTVAPCVNASLATFSVRDGQVVYALGALKGVGADAMGLIVTARGDKPFATLFDLARRVDLKRVGKRPLEMLARAGAFDVLDPNRARVFEALDPLVAYSAAIHEAKSSNQVSLFGEAGADIPEPRVAFRDDWQPDSFYDKIKYNAGGGMHTLALLGACPRVCVWEGGTGGVGGTGSEGGDNVRNGQGEPFSRAQTLIAPHAHTPPPAPPTQTSRCGSPTLSCWRARARRRSSPRAS
jgi:hypothetical protein